MRGAIRRNDAVVIQFEDCAVKDEGEGRDQLRPDARQQDAGNNDYQRIEKVERAVPTASFMNDHADQNEIGENLERGLETMLLPDGKQQHVKQRDAEPEQNRAEEEP